MIETCVLLFSCLSIKVSAGLQMSAPSRDSSVTGVGGEEILCSALQELGFGIERNRIVRKCDGQEADANSQQCWHQQVDAWKYFARQGHFSSATRAWNAWAQEYAPFCTPEDVERLMWQASWWDLRGLTEIDFILKPSTAWPSDVSADFPTPFSLWRPGAALRFLSGRQFRQLFTRGFLVESTLANGSYVDKSAKLQTLQRLASIRGQSEGIALFYNGTEFGSPPARNIPPETLVIYFAQSATVTFPSRLKDRMLESKEQELEKETEERKRKEQELEKETEERKRKEQELKRKEQELQTERNEVKRLRTLCEHSSAQ